MAARYDERYVAYVQKQLDAAEEEYQENLRFKKHLMLLISIFFVVTVGVLVINSFFRSDVGAGIGGIALLVFCFTAMGCHLFWPGCKIKRYEALDTCAEKIQAYAKPYPKWLLSEKIEEDSAANFKKDSKEICGVLAASASQ